MDRYVSFEGHGIIVLAYGRHFNLGRATGLLLRDVAHVHEAGPCAASLVQETWLAVWRGRPSFFFEPFVFSTRGAYFLVLRWVPRGPERGVSDPSGSGIPLRSFSFLRSDPISCGWHESKRQIS